VGELYIGGEGVARGYQGRPELTAERFVPHPFSQQPGERLYRTGDLTRYRSDGTIEFLGRRDNQVKLRGFRIELGEIEEVLKEVPEVQDALVVVQELTAGEKRLLAYVVAEQDEVSVEQVRAHLRERLPDYMVPASITLLTAFPLNANGKIDRKALLELTAEQNASSDAIMLARDSVELRLVQIWEEVLNTRPISITEDFFSLGGHSLMIVAMMAQIRQHFNQQLSPAVIFQAGTVEKLAHLLRQRTDRASWTPIVPIQPHGTKPPFFCVHPGTGSIFSFLHLARHLGSERPFYGIQARGIDGEQEPLTRIEDMATCYIEALRLIQPEGPYYLGGHSLGGMIAFEMAHQLHAQGQEVAFLGVIDTTPPVIKVESVLQRDDTTELIEFMQVAARFFGIDLEITYEELHQLEPEQQLQLAQGLLHNHLLTTQGDISLLRNYLTVQRAHSKCMHYYQPRPYTGEVTLFRAATVHPYEYQDEYAAIFDDPLLGWGPFSAKPVEVHIVPGDHISMMVDPHVQTLAERLRNCLDRVQAQSGRASIG